MMNNCHSSYVFYAEVGNEERLLLLHSKLSEVLAKANAESNYSKPRWLRDVFIAHGLDWGDEVGSGDCTCGLDSTHDLKCNFKIQPNGVLELDKSIVYGRDVVKANNRENPKISNLAYFTLQTSTKGKPPTELWEAVISQYEGVSFVYFAECEDGSGVGKDDKGGKVGKVGKVGIFINTDREGLFFKERYSLWISCNEKALDRLASIASEDSGVLAIITNRNDERQCFSGSDSYVGSSGSNGSNSSNSSNSSNGSNGIDSTNISNDIEGTNGNSPLNKGISPNTHSTQEIQIREYFDTFEELREYFIKLTKKDFGSVEQMQSHLSSIASYVNGVRNAYFMASVKEYLHE